MLKRWEQRNFVVYAWTRRIFLMVRLIKKEVESELNSITPSGIRQRNEERPSMKSELWQGKRKTIGNISNYQGIDSFSCCLGFE